jgi:hypothetical protein
MSAGFEHFWQYGIQCDHAGCKAAVWRIGYSEQLAYTKAQQDARAAGWLVAADRLVSHEDLCREHALKHAAALLAMEMLKP